MIHGFYSAGAGVKSYQQSLDIIANNLANVNTIGFKAGRASFQDLLYQNMRAPASYTSENLKVGAGSAPVEAAKMFGPAAFETTSEPLDVALDGDGFFAVERDGNVYYTRSGAFSLSLEGDDMYLVTKNGDYVLDPQGQHIVIEPPVDSVVFGGPGDNPTEGMIELQVVKFPNQYALEQVGDSMFRETELSKAPVPAEQTKVVNRAVEMSGVSTATEMSQMIVTQRAYSLNARAVQTADQIEEYTLGMKR